MTGAASDYGNWAETRDQALARVRVRPDPAIFHPSGTAEELARSLARVTIQRDSGIFVPTGTLEELEQSLARVTIQRDSGIFVPTGTPEELEQSLARAKAQLRPGTTVSSEILKNLVEQALSHLAEDNPHVIPNMARELTKYLNTYTTSESSRRQHRLTGAQMAQLTGVFLLVSVGTMLQVSVPKEFDAMTKVTGFVADAVAIGAAISIIRIAVRRNRQD